MEPEFALHWKRRGRDFLSSRSGRFDLFRSSWDGSWVCIDWDDGKRHCGEFDECQEWAKARAQQTVEAAK